MYKICSLTFFLNLFPRQKILFLHIQLIFFSSVLYSSCNLRQRLHNIISHYFIVSLNSKSETRTQDKGWHNLPRGTTYPGLPYRISNYHILTITLIAFMHWVILCTTVLAALRKAKLIKVNYSIHTSE